MSTETVRPTEPVRPVTGTSTVTPVGELSGIAAFGDAVNTFAVPVPPPVVSGVTDFAMSSFTFATLTFGFDGWYVPVGDHRKSMCVLVLSVQNRPPMILRSALSSRM